MESEIEEKLTKQLTIRFTESQLERIKAIAKKDRSQGSRSN